MIDFNENDYNLVKIRRESKLFNLVTKHEFRVYGLRQSGNPLIWIEYNRYDQRISSLILSKLQDFFTKNNINIEFERRNDEEYVVNIGLRRDLREHVVLSSAIIQTIIYALEGKLDLDSSQVIPGIPKFATS